MTPLVSVIVPIYKVEPYLRQCLDSIVNQTYTNLEIILVDDGSPDGCPAICDEYAAKDNRIVVIHKENGGLSDARNAGLDICKGEYVYFVDSDDWIFTNCLEVFTERLKTKQYDFIVARHVKEYEISRRIEKVYLIPGELTDSQSILRSFCQRDFPVCAWNKLYKTVFLKENNLFFEKGLLFEDQLWCFDSAISANMVCVLDNITYHYNIRATSIMTNSSLDLSLRISSWERILQKLSIKIQNSSMSSREQTAFLQSKIIEYLNHIASMKGNTINSFLRLKKILGYTPLKLWQKNHKKGRGLLFLILQVFPKYLGAKIFITLLKYA